MQNIVIAKPYRFVAPHPGKLWWHLFRPLLPACLRYWRICVAGAATVIASSLSAVTPDYQPVDRQMADFASTDERIWRPAVRRLADVHFDRDAAREYLVALLADSSPDKRAMCGRMLLELGFSDGIMALRQILTDAAVTEPSHPNSVADALGALQQYRQKIPVDILVTLARHGNREALRTASLQGVDEIRPMLVEEIRQDPGMLGLYDLVRHLGHPSSVEVQALGIQKARQDVRQSFRDYAEVQWLLVSGEPSTEKFVIEAVQQHALHVSASSQIDGFAANRAFAAVCSRVFAFAKPLLEDIAVRGESPDVREQALAGLFYVYRDYAFVDLLVANRIGTGDVTAPLEWRIAAARHTPHLVEVAGTNKTLFALHFGLERYWPIERWIFQCLGAVPLSAQVAVKGP